LELDIALTAPEQSPGNPGWMQSFRITEEWAIWQHKGRLNN
jgi:hypothetical protein